MAQRQQGATFAFKTKTVSEALSQHFKEDKVTIKGAPLILVNELLRVFTKESLTRAADQAKKEGNSVVSIDHFEKILTQLLLDI